MKQKFKILKQNNVENNCTHFVFIRVECEEFEWNETLTDKQKEQLAERNKKRKPQVGDIYNTQLGLIIYFSLSMHLDRVRATVELRKLTRSKCKKGFSIREYSEPLTYADIPDDLIFEEEVDYNAGELSKL